MHNDVTSIYFSTVLQYPPFEGFPITRDQVQSLFHELSKDAGNRYENLHLQGRPPYFSTEREDDSGMSRCEIGKQSIKIFEDKPDITIEQFSDRVCAILKALGDDCPPFLFQRCEVRILANPTHAKSALELLAKGPASVYEAIEPFGRPPSHFGLRFRFLPYSASDIEEQEEDESQSEGPFELVSQDPDNPEGEESFVSARFETYTKNSKQVWIEVVSSCPCRTAIIPENIAPVNKHILSTYQFATDKCLSFLNQWDIKPPGREEG
jgi:hypothetical protein